MLHVDHPTTSPSMETINASSASSSSSSKEVTCAPSPVSLSPSVGQVAVVTAEEEEPLIQVVECRICQEEDHIKNLETPCACSGSLKV